MPYKDKEKKRANDKIYREVHHLEYRWRTMIARCTNPKNHKYKTYGARGIKVCDKWKKFEGFFEDMGEPGPGMSLERIDNDGDYCKENCRWATQKEQSANTRQNIPVEVNGVRCTLQDISKILGTNYHTLYNRLFVYNWNYEKLKRQ